MVISSRRLVLRCFPWLHQAKKRKLAPSSSPLSTSKVAVYGPLATGMVSRSARPITRDGMHWQGGAMRGLARCFRWCSRGSRFFAQNFPLQTNFSWTQMSFGVNWFLDGPNTRQDDNIMYLRDLDFEAYMRCIQLVTLNVGWSFFGSRSEFVLFRQCSNVGWLRILAFKEAVLLSLLWCSSYLEPGEPPTLLYTAYGSHAAHRSTRLDWYSNPYGMYGILLCEQIGVVTNNLLLSQVSTKSDSINFWSNSNPPKKTSRNPGGFEMQLNGFMCTGRLRYAAFQGSALGETRSRLRNSVSCDPRKS